MSVQGRRQLLSAINLVSSDFETNYQFKKLCDACKPLKRNAGSSESTRKYSANMANEMKESRVFVSVRQITSSIYWSDAKLSIRVTKDRN